MSLTHQYLTKPLRIHFKTTWFASRSLSLELYEVEVDCLSVDVQTSSPLSQFWKITSDINNVTASSLKSRYLTDFEELSPLGNLICYCQFNLVSGVLKDFMVLVHLFLSLN